ncbi:hypothetical protein Bp8pS_229 [Bacillus phage vB_BpuM-BpSp]|nr:hypothetical protein Bp8pS_229 [Bacillus phage vB_BpuM-BpSp]
MEIFFSRSVINIKTNNPKEDHLKILLGCISKAKKDSFLKELNELGVNGFLNESYLLRKYRSWDFIDIEIDFIFNMDKGWECEYNIDYQEVNGPVKEYFRLLDTRDKLEKI